MLLTTTENIPGKEYEVLGIAKGGTVQSKHIGKDIMAGLKTIVGGELTGYTEMMNEARAMATKRMVAEAEKLGADAIVSIRYVSATITTAAAEIVAYGTAVKYRI
ncbi:MAG: heavy metal-binding domain-containing protein [Peptococcaceae bacterium]|nr:heavy metal-binding domain-containing protein [Peptococcaceae bacterium]